MNILLIGGAGFIGSVLQRVLRSSGAQVTVLDIQPAPDGVTSEYVQADIRDYSAIAPHFASRDLVINLAAEHRDDIRPISLYDEVNVDGARNICRAAAQAGVKWQIFTSSVAVYGESSVPLHEDSEIAYFNDYGRTKFLAEGIYREWSNGGSGRRLHIVRPTVVFGPGNRGNVYNLLRQIKFGPFLMVGDGSNVKAIAHVDNVAGFLGYIASDMVPPGVYNYADGPDLSINEIVKLTQAALGRDTTGPGLRLPLPVGLVLGKLADLAAWVFKRPLPISAIRIRKFCSNSEVDATRMLSTGYTPSREVREGLAEMVRVHV